MERLTIPDVRVDEHTIRRTFVDAGTVRARAMEFYWRLKDYEDTGLTPQEIASMRNTLGNIGATVYVLLQDGAIYYPETNGWYISEEFIGAISRAGFWLGKPEDGVYVSDDRIGKTVFFTREEAEQALRKEKVKK